MRRVPGELRLTGLLGVVILFLVVDLFVYGVTSKVFRRYQASTPTASGARLDKLEERLDAVEQQQRSLKGDVSDANAAAAAAGKQSELAMERFRQLEQEQRKSPSKSKR